MDHQSPGLLDPGSTELSFALACLPMGVAIITAGHCIRWANTRMTVLTGEDLATLQGLTCTEVTAPDDRDAEREALSPLHAGRCTTAEWRRRFGPLHGVRRWCTVTAHGRYAADGELRDMLWLVQPDPTPNDPAVLAAARRQTYLRGERAGLAALLSHDAVQATRMISSYAGLAAQGLSTGMVTVDARHLMAIQQASTDLGAMLRQAVACLRVPDQLVVSLPHLPPGALAAAVANVVEQLALPAIRVQGDLVIDLEVEQLERCLQPVLEYAVASSALGQVVVSASLVDFCQVIEVTAHGATVEPAQAARAAQLGARTANGRLTGLAVAQAILVATGGGLTIACTGGMLVLSLSVGPAASG